jgi:hypothetical protein
MSTDRSRDSRSHHWRIIVDGNIAYHLTHNAGKSRKIQQKVRALGFEPWWVASHWTVLLAIIRLEAHSPRALLVATGEDCIYADIVYFLCVSHFLFVAQVN